MTRRSRIPRTAALGLVAVVALSACTASETTQSTSVKITTSSPDATLTVIADASDIAASVSTSRELFDSAPVVVVAPTGVPEAQEVAARAAISLGVPLLIGEAERPAANGSDPGADGEDSTDGESSSGVESSSDVEAANGSDLGADGESSSDGESASGVGSSSDAEQPAANGSDQGTDGEDSTDGESTSGVESSSDVEAPSEAGELLADELERLKTTTVLLVGDAAELPGGGTDGSGVTSVRAEATAAAVGDAIGARLATPASEDPATFVTEIAALEPSKRTTPSTPSADEEPQIPAAKRARPIDDIAALAMNGVEQLAAVATTRAAGIPVHVLTGGSANPQAEASAIDALHATPGDKTLALGAAFGSEPALDWKVRTARTGAQLPGGGQLLFEDHQFVALYGTPSTPVLGVLGEQDVAGSVARAQEVAAPYQGLTDKTVVPMFEIIASVAAGGPGQDGNFSNELSAESLRPWIDAAAAAGMYVVIDLQPGRTDFLTQAQQYQSLLELPNVGLALDPEWRLAPDEFHLRTIGSVSAAEVNSVAHWLADLTNEKGLPQKMLVVHQFRPSMVSDRHTLDLSRPEIAMLIHVDGQGGQPDKQATWANLQRDAPAGVAWGWKNFYDEDVPMLTPEQTISGVQPTPELITYQ